MPQMSGTIIVVTVSGIVDDGLDHQHPDIIDNYDANYSYDWCNDDSDPTPSSWMQTTSLAGVKWLEIVTIC